MNKPRFHSTPRLRNKHATEDFTRPAGSAQNFSRENHVRFTMTHKFTPILFGTLLALAGRVIAGDVPQFSTEKPASLLNQPAAFGVTFVSAGPQLFPETKEHHSSTASSLLRDILNANLQSFVFFGTDKFKAFDAEKFQGLVRQWASALSGGYGMTYLGELKKGYATTVWRVRFLNGGDDALVFSGPTNVAV